MLLVIDTGNTNTVIGLYDPSAIGDTADSGLIDHWRISTSRERTSDEFAIMLQGLFDVVNVDWSDITGVSVCSGVPRFTQAIRLMVERYLDLEPVIVGTGVKTGMPVLYENPREVGPDRIANAVGAHDLYGGPLIVVDFGTGTNFDIVSANGEFLGGTISPGIEISLDALFDRAAALRAVEMVEPRNVIGKTTAESLQSGTLYGFAAQVDGMVKRFEAEIGKSTIIATGGIAPLISPFADTIEHIEPWLTLHGLRVIHNKN